MLRRVLGLEIIFEYRSLILGNYSTPPSTPYLAESKGVAKGLRTRDYIRISKSDFGELLMHYTTKKAEGGIIAWIRTY